MLNTLYRVLNLKRKNSQPYSFSFVGLFSTKEKRNYFLSFESAIAEKKAELNDYHLKSANFQGRNMLTLSGRKYAW